MGEGGCGGTAVKICWISDDIIFIQPEVEN